MHAFNGFEFSSANSECVGLPYAGAAFFHCAFIAWLEGYPHRLNSSPSDILPVLLINNTEGDMV